VSEESEKLIVTSMAKEPEARFKDLNAMKLAVQAGLDALERAPKSPAPAPPPPKKTPSPIKTRSPMMTPSPMKRPTAKKPPSAEYRSTPTPARKSATPKGSRKTPRGGDPTPRGPVKSVTPHRSGKKTAAHSKSGAHKTGRHPSQSKGSPALLIGAGVSFAAVLLIIVILAVVMGGNGNDDSDSGGKGKGGETSGSSKSGTSGSGKGGETSSGTGDGTSGTGTTPTDEPEGPFEPPRLPKGVRVGDNPGEYVNEKDETVLVYVPAGRAKLGLSQENADWIKSWFPEIKMSDLVQSMPERSVYLDGFFIGKYEITNEQYELFLDWFKANPGQRDRVIHPESPTGNNPTPTWWGIPAFSAPDAAVVGMDWFDAHAYAKWAGMELPTEAQWLKAATWDPKKKQGRMFPWGDSVDDRAALVADRVAEKLFKTYWDFAEWNRGSSAKHREAMRPAAVESQGQDVSAVGAVGMCGNVEEWCRDNWHRDFFRDPDASDRNACDYAYYPGRVSRGGYSSRPLVAYFERGGYYAEGNGQRHLGFRCAIPLVSTPEDILTDIGEADLRALPGPVKKRTVMGLLEKMKVEKDDAGVIMRAKWALDQWEEESDFYIRLAVALANSDKINEALFQLETGVNLGKHPVESGRLHEWVGWCHWEGKEYDKAYIAFKKSCEVNPAQYASYYWCARYFREYKKEYQKAFEQFEKAYRRDWAGTNALIGAAICKNHLGDFKASVEYYDRIIAQTDKSGYLYDRGSVLVKLKQYERAEKDFRKCLEKRDSSCAYLGMAEMFEARGDKKKALETAEKGLKFPSTDNWAHNRMKALRDRLKKG
ncbi:MAG: SUMF1/EgtB/PvdO family nonheme iron enzyme, partial [Planctomycetota bacterium]|jgi:formylglycine-generating enzyme required for sulfatase activity/Tfp pilus assembly protein PilF